MDVASIYLKHSGVDVKPRKGKDIYTRCEVKGKEAYLYAYSPRLKKEYIICNVCATDSSRLGVSWDCLTTYYMNLELGKLNLEQH
jgi:hypothetical protein